MEDKLTISALRQMKRDGRKIVGVVAWDTEIARIADRAGVDFISVGDSVGLNLWGHATDTEVTVEEMLILCKAVRSQCFAGSPTRRSLRLPLGTTFRAGCRHLRAAPGTHDEQIDRTKSD